MIETNSLTKIFRTREVETSALNEVTIAVVVGEYVAVMGPSGCGKSTLLNILGLLDAPTSGRYRFMGEDVTAYGERKRAALRKRHVGFVFQNFNLIDELTVYENIELPLLYHRTETAERKRRVGEMLERFDLVPRRSHYPQQLSGGMQQRVAVARAVVCRPSLILADEPTGNLDSSNGAAVINTLSSLNEEGTTIVMVTHSSEYAAQSRRVVQLFDGGVVAERVGAMQHA